MKKLKKILLSTLIFLITLSIVSIPFAGGIIYAFNFQKISRPDYAITPGLVNYEEIKNVLPRKEIKYSSNNATLNGYFYENDSIDNLIIVSHGINDGADSLLFVCKYFYDLGYSVFSYDNSGSFDSTGKNEGFTQPLIDLKYTIDFLNSSEPFKDSKKLLFGFSAGGFATSAVLSFNQPNIVASVSVSAFNDSSSLLIEKGKSYVGPIVYAGKWLVDIIQNKKFGNYLNYTSIDGINSSNKPVFVVHGTNDKTIRIDVDSIVAKENEITNPNFKSYIENGATHTSILYSNEAVLYQNEVNAILKKINNKNKKVTYVSTVDDYKYSEINSDLFNKINEFYKNHL